MGDQLVYEKRGTTDIYYYYDSLGVPTSIKWYNGNTEQTMYLATNMVGDVIGLYSDTGVLMVQFEYDAWGNIVSTTYTVGSNLSGSAQEYADICPFRYRGYYFDADTGLYYLRSRYYDSAICRFISADESLIGGRGLCGWNMYAYCLSNPAKHIDSEGKDAVVLLDKDFPSHIGALIQDSSGNWWHFYWGAKNLAWGICSFLYIPVPARTWCELYTGEISLEQINAEGSYKNGYEEMLYLEGDF